MPFWIEYFAVAVCAISVVLAAEGKRMDLFGVMVLALVAAVGGGTIRDLCLGVRPVFWIEQPQAVWTALIAAAVTFVAAFVRAHPDDWGMVVHELTHVMQSYPTDGPGWLVEGIADYIRIVHFEP